MAQAIQPINRNSLQYQRSLQQQQGGFRQWLSLAEPENDSNPAHTNLQVLTRPKTSLEDLLLLQQEDFGQPSTSFAPHVEVLNPYTAFAVPADIDEGQYVFEFLTDALPGPGDKINREI